MGSDPAGNDRHRWRSREHFLGGAGSAEDVRPSIARSWLRSRESGVRPDDRTGMPAVEFDPDLKLLRLARPVLDRLADEVADVDMTVILTDPRGLVLDRRAGSPALRRGLDRVHLAPGHSYGEETVGTNGIGTAAEDREAAWVIGSEHYAEWLRWLSCAGVPIRNPITGRVEGILDLTCRLADTNQLMLPFVREGARQLEQRLYEEASQADRELLEQFLRVAHRSRHAVIAVNRETIISNAAAGRLLEPSDHALLWSQVGEATAIGAETSYEIRLSQGTAATVRLLASGAAGPEQGAVVELDVGAAARGITAPAPTPRPGSPAPPGRSLTWERAWRAAQELAPTGLPLLIVGEAGSGKLTLASYVHEQSRRGEPFTVLDASLAGTVGGDAWCEGVRARLDDVTGTLVLRHLEALAAATARSLDAILVSAGTLPSLRLVATLSVARGADVPSGLPVLDRFAATLHAPPLRERPEDVADLVPALIRRHAGDAPVRCSREVIQVLMRADWPGNVRQLESLLKTMLARRQVGELTLRDLPPEYLQLPDRRLTAMQHAQRAAILHALERTAGNKSQAAMLLGISRVTIYRKLKELGIAEP